MSDHAKDQPTSIDEFLSGEAGERILELLTNDQCTPILGPELTREETALIARTASDWAEETEFPFEEPRDLPWVAECLALHKDYDAPRSRLAKAYEVIRAEHPAALELYRQLGEFPVSVYLCTHHHEFLLEGIRSASGGHFRDPQLQLLPWNPILEAELNFAPDSSLGKLLNRNMRGNKQSPLVLHLFGQCGRPNKPDEQERNVSMVVTERDHMDFLHAVSAESEMIPPAIDRALGMNNLLFLGYRLVGLHFQILLRTLKDKLSRNKFKNRHIAVQFIDLKDDTQRCRAQDYLRKYLSEESIRILPGRPVEFVKAVHQKLLQPTHAC